MIDHIRDTFTGGCRRGMPMFCDLPLRTEAEMRAGVAEMPPPPFPPIGTKTLSEVRRSLMR